MSVLMASSDQHCQTDLYSVKNNIIFYKLRVKILRQMLFTFLNAQ